ncbi:MAG: response regulator [Magnetococcales bacterium]|nr:response regulator [Magnetococcales bacterium]
MSTHILVIDDDLDFRDMLEQMLTEADFQVTTAQDGKEGLARYRQSPSDLVITDILMPEMEGIETISALMKQGRQPKILAISGGSRHLSSDSVLHAARCIGARRILNKPFTRGQLFAEIEALMADT